MANQDKELGFGQKVLTFDANQRVLWSIREREKECWPQSARVSSLTMVNQSVDRGQ